MEFNEFLKQAANVKPSKKQLEWFDTEFYAFIHFTVNTFTDREWGLGNEDELIFNPVKLDCRQWVKAIKSAGMKGMVLTAKHHDGFCLWPSKYTEHCIKNSPYKDGKGDIVAEAAEACREGGIKFGFYLSPWDRNSRYYGTDEYNDYFKAQLTELLTNYGKIFHVWFDGACGEGPNGKRQVYDYNGYIATIRKYQPDATIYSDFGPDVRWCGNEAGSPRAAEWAVVPSELTVRAEKQTGGQVLKGDMSYIFSRDQLIGSLPTILYSKGLCFAGAEYDMSIRRGWFYHADQTPWPLEKLFNTYLGTVGGNACLNLNIPPNRDGLFDETDVIRLKELGDLIRSSFRDNLMKDAKVTKVAVDSDTQAVYDISFPTKRMVKYVVLKEDISKGQRVEGFLVMTSDNIIAPRYDGTTIGHKRICVINKETDFLRVHITAARGAVNLLPIEVY
jgi:alpha-L-fucosidase